MNKKKFKIKKLMLKIFQKILNKITFTAKYERTTLFESLEHVRKMGFTPNTIFDIGVAKGTKDLYKAFPDSFFVLIEPIKEYESYMKKILKKYQGIYKLTAASSEKGYASFNLHPNHMDGSSILKEETGKESDGYEIKVSTSKIDDIVSEENLKGPFILKVDVQGLEMEVIKGAIETLKETEIVTLEVSLFKFMKGAPDFYEILEFMKKYGFVVYDILKGLYRPLDNALGQVDIVFVKENGRFRNDHRFASKKQLKKFGFI